MVKNVLLNTVVGAVVVFILSSIWHVATPLGEVGVQNLPNATILSPAMKLAIPNAGFYFFPGMNRSKGMTREQQRAEQEKYLNAYKAGPTGILIYTPGGENLNYGKLLVNQFLIGLLCAFFIAWILAVTAVATTFAQRVLIALFVSAFGAILVSFEYWNWYNFPSDYTITYAAGIVVTWGLTGTGMAWLAGKRKKRRHEATNRERGGNGSSLKTGFTFEGSQRTGEMGRHQMLDIMQRARRFPRRPCRLPRTS